jgi:hypothetical protein
MIVEQIEQIHQHSKPKDKVQHKNKYSYNINVII